jgi:hypothetical protein
MLIIVGLIASALAQGHLPTSSISVCGFFFGTGLITINLNWNFFDEFGIVF